MNTAVLSRRGAEAAGVAFAEREADPVEVFADRHGVLAGGSEQVTEFGHRHRRAAVELADDPPAEVGGGLEVEVELRADLDGPLLVAEQGEQLGDDDAVPRGGERPADAIGQHQGRVDAQEVIGRGQEVLGADRAVCGVAGDLVGLPDDPAPADPAAGNGALLVDVPNRGNAYANALYNSPRTVPMQSGNLEPGTGFLEDRGYAVAEVYAEAT